MALIQNNAKADKTAFLDFSVSTVSKTNGDADFEQVMQTTKEAPEQTRSDAKEVQSCAKPEKDTLKEKLSNMSTKAQEKLASSGTEDNTEKAAEIFATLFADIKELLMQTFDVSEGELMDAMSELQLTDMDLLNADVIKQLSAELTGAENMMELLFNPEFTDALKSLNENMEELKKEVFDATGLTEKDAEKLLAQPEQPLMEEAETKAVEIKTDRAEHGKEAVTEQPAQNQTQQVTVEKDALTENDNGASGTDSEFSEHMPQMTAADQIMSNMTQAVEEAMPEVDAENVVKQLVEQIRVAVNEESTSFEMQLNPEHLGKINLQVVAKDGVVTAQIATENAAVKEAIESQLVMLKESLINQGVQVEAVEVTIASHGFERNLDEQQKQNEEGQGNQKKRFRFDVMDNSDEELTQADMIMRDMMLANGNQINYMA